MDRLEEQAKIYLESLDLGSVVHEPNGPATFPDFLVGGEILFEVTRLETPIQMEGAAVGHTELFAPLAQTISNIFEKADLRAKCGREVFVSLDIVLPVDRQRIRSALKEVLNAIADDARQFTSGRMELCDGVRLRVFFGEKNENPKVRLGSLVPSDLAGWVVPEVVRQIKFAAGKKAPKLAAYTGNFEEAWLMVGGGAALGLSGYSLRGVVEELEQVARWTGLVIVNPDNPPQSKRILFD